MNCLKSVQCPLCNMSIFKFGKTFNFHNILFFRCQINYPNHFSITKNSSDIVKKIYTQMWKYQFLKDTKQERQKKIQKWDLIRNYISIIILYNDNYLIFLRNLFISNCTWFCNKINPLNTNPTKWSNIVKQFVGNSWRIV